MYWASEVHYSKTVVTKARLGGGGGGGPKKKNGTKGGGGGWSPICPGTGFRQPCSSITRDLARMWIWG